MPGTEYICSFSFLLPKMNYLNFNPGNPTTEIAVIRAYQKKKYNEYFAF